MKLDFKHLFGGFDAWPRLKSAVKSHRQSEFTG
jgi:hypothetical protein